MSAVLLAVTALALGLVCPAMMLYERRRGRQTACGMPMRTSPKATVSHLRDRQGALRAEIERRSSSREHDSDLPTPA